jgi:hypothetical protein
MHETGRGARSARRSVVARAAKRAAARSKRSSRFSAGPPGSAAGPSARPARARVRQRQWAEVLGEKGAAEPRISVALTRHEHMFACADASGDPRRRPVPGRATPSILRPAARPSSTPALRAGTARPCRVCVGCRALPGRGLGACSAPTTRRTDERRRKPTAKQLAYLRGLAAQVGQSFVYPRQSGSPRAHPHRAAGSRR